MSLNLLIYIVIHRSLPSFCITADKFTLELFPIIYAKKFLNAQKITVAQIADY